MKIATTSVLKKLKLKTQIYNGKFFSKNELLRCTNDD